VAAARHEPACALFSSPARALAARGRGNLGPGRYFALPPGPKMPFTRGNDRDRPIAIDGCAWILAEQNPLALAHANPSSIHPLPRRVLLPHPSTRVSGGRRRPSERRHGEPPRRRARPPQGERAVVERLHRGAQIHSTASGPAEARAASVHARHKASRDRVDAPASHARRRWAAQGETRYVLL
jgi:hypothetical protein